MDQPPRLYLAHDVLGQRLAVLDLDVLEHLVGEAEFLGQQIQDFTVALRFEERLDDLLVRLQRAVRRGARAPVFVLGAGRQQVGAVLALAEDGPLSGMWIAHHEQVEFFDAPGGDRNAGEGVRAVSQHHHGLDVVLLLDLILGQHCGIEPARRRDTGRVHHLGIVEAVAQPLEVRLPNSRPMLPGAFGEAGVERQARDIETHVARALHVVVAAERIGAVADAANVAGSEQQDAAGAHVGGADRVLGLPHRPDHAGRLLLGDGLGDPLELRLRNPRHPLNLVGRPLLDLLADLVHAVDALADEFLVLPAVLEDVPEHPVEQRDVGAGAHPHIVGCVRRRARHARIDDDHVRAVELLALQHVLQRHRMRLRRIAAHDEHGLGVADVVEAVGHRAIAPGIGQAGDGRGMADARCVVDVVGAPERREFAAKIGFFVGELGRADPVDRIRSGFFADGRELVDDLVDGGLPAQPGPLAVHELHRIFQAAIAVHDLARRSALGAMGAAIDRRVPGGFLADPHAIGDLRRHRAANRAERADVLADGDLGAGRRRRPPPPCARCRTAARRASRDCRR